MGQRSRMMGMYVDELLIVESYSLDIWCKVASLSSALSDVEINQLRKQNP